MTKVHFAAIFQMHVAHGRLDCEVQMCSHTQNYFLHRIQQAIKCWHPDVELSYDV